MYSTPSKSGVPIPSSPATDFASSQQQIYSDLFGGEAFNLPNDDLIFPHNLFCDDDQYDEQDTFSTPIKVRVPHKIEYSY